MRTLPLALALLLSGCSSGNQPTTTETTHARPDNDSVRLTSYLDAAYEIELATSPDRLTNQGRKEQYDKLNDRSEAALDRTLDWRRKSVADMKSMFGYNLLNDDSDFGRLAGEIWRAVRLVVDTGLHSKDWTEEQAVQYFLANSPQPERSVRSEIRRYLVNPGQATSYKIGMITIQKLRDEARQALGGKFDYRAFHDVVLGGGSVPLPVLDGRVRRWIAASLDAGDRERRRQALCRPT